MPSHDKFDRSVVKCNIGQPPFIPNNISYPQELQQYLPIILSLIVNEAADKASSNIFRTYYYNAISENNWSNQFYLEAGQFISYLTYLLLLKRQTNNVEMAIKMAIDQGMRLLVSKAAMENTFLLNQVNPNIQSEAYNNAQQYSALVNEIKANFMQQSNNPMMQQPNNPVMQQQYSPFQQNNPAMQQQYSPFQQNIPPWQTQPDPRFMGGFSNTPYNQPNLNTGPISRHSIGTVNQPPASSGIFSQNLNEPIQQSVPQNLNFNNSPTINSNVTPNAVSSVYDWTSSIDQKYLTLYDKSKQEEIFVFSELGNLVQKVVKKETPPNSPGANMPNPEVVFNGISYNVSDILKSSNTNDNEPVVNENIHETITGKNMFLSMEDAFIQSQLYFLTRDKEVVTQTMFGYILHPYFSKIDLNLLFNNLIECDSFMKIQKRLMAIIESIKRMNHEDKKDFSPDIYIESFNRMLTDIVNSYLKNELALSNLSIQSFIEDILELPDYLANNYSNRYSEEFDAFNHRLSKNMFIDIKTSNAVKFSSSDKNTNSLIYDFDNFVFDKMLCMKVDSKKPNVVYLPTTISITQSIFLDRSFDNQLSKTRKVTENNHQHLYELLKDSFVEIDKRHDFIQDNYLVTASNDRYKIYKGALADNVYLIGK